MAAQQYITIGLEALLGFFSAYMAYSLFTGTPESVQKGRDALNFPRWYWVLAGSVASIGSVGLLAGLFVSTVGAIASAWMIAYFVVATLTHLVRRDFQSLGLPIVFGLIFVGLTWLHWSDVASMFHL